MEFTKPILVAGIVPLWAKILIWLFRGAFAFAVYIWSQQGFRFNNDRFVFVTIVVICWICYEISLLVLFFKRRWICRMDGGFTYTSIFGTQSFLFDEIDGTSIQVKELPSDIQFFGKHHTKIIRNFRIWIRDRNKPIRLPWTSRNDKPDPLYDFITEITKNILDRFDEKLEMGGSIQGTGWTFSKQSFGFTDESGISNTLSIAEIGTAETIGDRFHIWRRGDAEECFSTPINGKNADWLHLYLRLAIIPDGQLTKGLGRFLFETKRPSGCILTIIGMIVFAVMVLLPFVCPKDGDDDLLMLIIYEIIAGLVLVILPSIWVFTCGKRFYENGIVTVLPFSEKEILFEQIETFEWSRTDHYHNGGHAGSHFTFILYLLPEKEIRKFNLSFFNRKGEEGNYGTIRQKLAASLSRRMKTEWQETKNIPWVDGVRLTETAVVFEQKKRGRVIGTTILPFDQISMYGMMEKTTAPTFAILHQDGKQGIQFGTGQRNFFPGLNLFYEIMAH